MPQCVNKMVQVSNLYLQRGGAKFQFLVSGCKPNISVKKISTFEAEIMSPFEVVIVLGSF